MKHRWPQNTASLAYRAGICLRRTLLLVFFLPGLVVCADASDLETGRLSVGAEWDSLHYKEAGIMSEDGSLYGVCGSYAVNINDLALQLSGSIAQGTVRYDGGYVDLETGEEFPLQLDSPNTLTQLRGICSWKTTDAGHLKLTPFAGLGYRLLIDDLPTEYGYRREQYYFYLPVGLDVAVSEGAWTYGLRLGHNLLLAGYNYSSDEEWEVGLIQETGYGFEVACRIGRKISDNARLSLSLEPFWTYWHVDDSNVSDDGWYEPENTCAVYGLKGIAAF